MIRLKNDSINLVGVVPQIFFALYVIDQVYIEKRKDTVITSAIDGRHSKTSLHYSGCAVDIRIYADIDSVVLVKEIKRRLCIDFDVILEKNHIHCEWQPRRRN